MGDMGFGLKPGMVARGALLAIPLFFIAPSRDPQWLTTIPGGEREAAVLERKRRALIVMAAVMSYLEAERLGAMGKLATSPAIEVKSTIQKGKNEEIQDHHRG
mgnify:CR=1 FL=1